MNSKEDYIPFYDSIYKKVHNFVIINGKSIEEFYDDRGLNILRNLKFLTHKNKRDIALDVGCGLGQVSFSLSKEYAMVVAADISKLALDVVKDVAKRKKIKNVYPIICDAAHLPFKNRTFDVIICSGILEWVPIAYSTNPIKIQLQVLNETSRVLSKSGTLWLGIENRMSINYLLGCIDHHSGMRGITFLPRIIANFYSKLVKKRPYKTYLYNYWELKKLLRLSGLDIHRSFTAFPYYSNPKIVCDISDFHGISDSVMFMPFSIFQKALIKLISKIKLTKLLIPSFIFICRKSSDAASLKTLFVNNKFE